jgi:anti-sigma regulatory factor (Ser/Thr protein kinase)
LGGGHRCPRALIEAVREKAVWATHFAGNREVAATIPAARTARATQAMTVQTPDSSIAGCGHAVHFYEHDAELAEGVGSLLVRALADGSVVIVIATERHRQAFDAELIAAGIDVVEAAETGALVTLDAATTLARFMRDGQVDAEEFDAVIGALVRRVAQTGKAICAYGEMVGLLWDAGDVLGAIELERCWNDLGREVGFLLHCGYHSACLAVPAHEEALAEVCRLHDTVVHKHEVAGQLPAQSESPRAARGLITDALRRWGLDKELVADAQLVVTELATNAVVHARTAFSVHVRHDASAVRISVTDSSCAEPSLGNPAQHDLSGRGLWLVSRLASRWGVEPTHAGKTVWAEL